MSSAIDEGKTAAILDESAVDSEPAGVEVDAEALVAERLGKLAYGGG